MKRSIPVALPTSAALLALALLACGGDGAVDPDADLQDTGGHGWIDAGYDSATGCPRAPAAADRTRKVVVSRPYAEGGGVTYDVFDLDSDGELTATGDSFDMGRSFIGLIEFTPDGEVGIAVHDGNDDQGTLGVFRFDAEGKPVVVHVGFDAGGVDDFWADSVVISADGAHAYVLNSQWRIHGGGIFKLAIECDGSLTYEGKVAASKLPGGLTFMAGEQRAVIAADDILDSSVDSDNDVYLLDWSGSPSVVTGVDAFGDDEAFPAGTALTADGKYYLVGDNNSFYDDVELENRVAVVEVTATGLEAVQVLGPIEDPIGIIPSPDNDAVVVLSGMGDAIVELSYDSGATPPFTLVGEIDYLSSGSLLPGGGVLIERGPLRGRVVIAENEGICQVGFSAGTVVDLGLTEVGEGVAGLIGAIGVQP